MENVESMLQTVESLTDQSSGIDAHDVSTVTNFVENVVALESPDRKVC